MSHLDRFLVTEDWEYHFSGMVQLIVPSHVSDHMARALDELMTD